MSVNQTATFHRYKPGSAQLPEALPGIAFDQREEITVWLEPADGTAPYVLQIGTHYNLALPTASSDGVITAIGTFDADDIFYAERNTPADQPASFDPFKTPPGKAIERALDRAAKRAQDQDRELSRSLRVARGEAAPVLPSRTARAKGALFFDEQGEATTVSVDDFAEPARDAANRSETALGLIEEFSQGISYTTRALGEAATKVGQFFRVPKGTIPETYTRYQRTAEGSIEAAALRTSKELADPDGATLIGFGPRNTAEKLGESVSLDDQIGGTDIEKFNAARDYLTGVGGGFLHIPRREVFLDATAYGASNITIRGEGRASHIRFAGQDPLAIGGTSNANPLQGNFRTSALAIVGQYPDDLTAAAYKPGHTGDYPVTSPRNFAPNSVIKAGSISFEAAEADLADLSPGDYLWLERGYLGWHTALHEMVQVKSINGGTVTLVWPTQNEYRNAASDPFNLFMRPIAYQGGVAAPGVDQAGFEGWVQCGWRRVVPIVNAWVENLRITNEAVRPGYANLALMFCRALDCGYRNIESGGGGIWNLGSENTHGDYLLGERSNPAFAQTDVLPGNGSNRPRFTNFDLRTGTLDVEEGCTRGYFQGRQNGNTKALQFCREITFDLISRNASGYGITINRSGPVRIEGTYQSAQPSIWVEHGDVFYDYPQATLAMHDSLVSLYFDGMGIEADCDTVESTANNSLEFYLRQPIKARGKVGGPFGAVYSLADNTAGYVVGNVRRIGDGTDQTAPSVSGRPTIYPVDRDVTFFDVTADRQWRRVNQNRKTIAAVTDASNFTVNAIATQGGVKAGDVAKVLIQNDTTVTVTTLKYVGGAPQRVPVDYPLGGARRWHHSVVTSANADTGNVELATPVPPNWSAVTGDATVSAANFGRWG